MSTKAPPKILHVMTVLRVLVEADRALATYDVVEELREREGLQHWSRHQVGRRLNRLTDEGFVDKDISNFGMAVAHAFWSPTEKGRTTIQEMDALPGVCVVNVSMVSAIACAKDGISKEEIARVVNREHMTGIDSNWAVTDEDFIDAPNPSPCPDGRPHAKHYLLTC